MARTLGSLVLLQQKFQNHFLAIPHQRLECDSLQDFRRSVLTLDLPLNATKTGGTQLINKSVDVSDA